MKWSRNKKINIQQKTYWPIMTNSSRQDKLATLLPDDLLKYLTVQIAG